MRTTFTVKIRSSGDPRQIHWQINDRWTRFTKAEAVATGTILSIIKREYGPGGMTETVMEGLQAESALSEQLDTVSEIENGEGAEGLTGSAGNVQPKESFYLEPQEEPRKKTISRTKWHHKKRKLKQPKNTVIKKVSC